MAGALTKSDPTASYSLATAARIIDRLEAEVGGREALAQTLLQAPPDASLDYVVGAIANPDNDLRKLSAICADGQVTIGEVLEAFKRGALAQASVRAIRAVAAATPAIVEDLVARAVVHEVDCPVCYGKGAVPGVDDKGLPVEKLCQRCDATGRVTQDPEFATQKFVLTELAGLGQQKGPSIVVDNSSKTVIADVSQAAYAKLLQSTDRLLHGRPAGVRTSTEIGRESVDSLPPDVIDVASSPADTPDHDVARDAAAPPA